MATYICLVVCYLLQGIAAYGMIRFMGDIQGKKLKKLTPKQRAFVSKYTEIGSNTFGNGTQALLAVRPGDYDGAKVQASQYLTDPNIASHIETLMSQIGLGSMFRLSTLKAIADADCETVEIVKREDGSKLRTKRGATAADRIRAIDIASRLAGDYDRARAEGNALSSRYKELAKRYAPREPTAKAKAHKRIIYGSDVEDASYTPLDAVQSNLAYCCAGAMACYSDGESA